MADAKKDPLDRIAVGALGEWAKGKSLEDLEVDVTSGEPFFPDTITRIDYLERKLIETPVLFRLPTPLEQTESHVRALDYLAKVKGLPASDFTEEKAISFFGQALVTYTDDLFTLEISLRKSSDKTRTYMVATELDRNHPTPSIHQALEKLTHLRKMIDYRLDSADLEDPVNFWAIIGGIAKRKNLSPLVGIGSDALDSYLIAMACKLSTFRTEQLSQASSASSTPSG